MTAWHTRIALGTLTGLAALSGSVHAHSVWLVPVATAAKDTVLELRFGGHEGREEPLVPAKLREIEARGDDGKKLAVRRSAAEGSVRLNVPAAAALVTVHLDNGIHSRPPQGPSVEKPMNEVPGATKATYADKYHKTILHWSPIVAKPVGQPFEVVPVGTNPPRAGQPVAVRVLLDGKPVEGVRLGRGEEPKSGDGASTDADGVATFVPTAGWNKLWAGRRSPVAGNPRYTELSYEYILGFEAK